jgi:hypothetical protein
MISREQVLNFLRGKQESNGGYTGNDLTELAKILNVTSFGLRRRLTSWIKNDKEFSEFIYLGTHLRQIQTKTPIGKAPYV